MRDDVTIENEAGTVDRRDPGRGQAALMVVYRDGIQVIPLEQDSPVSLGRGAPSDIQVHSRRLSRLHVQFSWDGERVRVVDQGSTNGTFLNGEQIQDGMLGPDDELTAGSVVVTLHRVGALLNALQGVERHEQFVALVEHEIARARTFGRGLAIVQLRALGDRGMLSRWIPRVHRLLRVVDRVGLFSPSAVELLFPEADVAEATRMARGLVTERGPGEPPLVAGVAAYPQHGSSAEALTQAALEAVGGASISDSVVVYSAESESGSIEDDGGPVVRDPRMAQVWRTIERIASASISVLIVGETGVGKEIVARGLHERSSRRNAPMRCINCGAIPQSLLESVLFGHEKGAFTGASRQRAGVFEEASGGTVLLDEVGELSLAAQVALLRVLEEREVTRVGGSGPVSVDVRVLAATHRDLEAMCADGRFRWDLYYRLNTMTLSIPALRNRVSEIRPFVRRFIEDANRVNHRSVVGVSPAALAILEDYSWPGNVRELRNVVERSVVIAPGDYITADDLPARVRAASSIEVEEDDEEELTDSVVAQDSLTLWESVQRMERKLISGALAACDGNQTRAADLLGLPRRTLVYKLRNLRISSPYRRDSANLPSHDSRGAKLSYADRIAHFEAKQIARALDRAAGDRMQAARLLGIQKRTLDKKLEQLSKPRAQVEQGLPG